MFNRAAVWSHFLVQTRNTVAGYLLPSPVAVEIGCL
jgi:hypothetical protein